MPGNHVDQPLLGHDAPQVLQIEPAIGKDQPGLGQGPAIADVAEPRLQGALGLRGIDALEDHIGNVQLPGHVRPDDVRRLVVGMVGEPQGHPGPAGLLQGSTPFGQGRQPQGRPGRKPAGAEPARHDQMQPLVGQGRGQFPADGAIPGGIGMIERFEGCVQGDAHESPPDRNGAKIPAGAPA